MIAADTPPADIVVTATRPADQSADERLGVIVIGAEDGNVYCFGAKP